ncbi:MAG: hypothetical protein C0483_25590 [Pirellula sp.]|nr:hypothetical protein [Pirellula sp.]
MAISWKTTAVFLWAAAQGAVLSAQWGSGPAFGPAGAGFSPNTNYATPPVVSLPPTQTPAELPVPSNAAPSNAAPATGPTIPANAGQAVMQPYNPVRTQPPAAATAPGSAPIATPYVPSPNAGGTMAANAGPQSYTLPNYPAPNSATPNYGAPNYNTASTAQLPIGQPTYTQTQVTTPQYGGQPMPPGNLTRSEISPYAKPQSPPSFTTWIPTKVASLLPHISSGATAPAQSSMPQPGYSPYGQQSCDPNVCCPPAAGCAPSEGMFDNVALISMFDAFKNPVDLDGLNANFGKRVGAFGAFPLLREWGIGGQIGATAGWYDWRGSQYTGDNDRFQNFTSVGIFQRPCGAGFGWGITHDWLYDDFYSDMHYSQFRVASSYQYEPGNEIGVWAALPQARDEAFIGTPAVQNRFQTLLQGNLYWRRVWCDWASTNIFAGLAESPSDISYGSNVQVAVNKYVAVTGAVEYVLPGSGGNVGRQEEIWNLSFGITIYPGSAMRNARSQFRPFLPMADNGNMAVWRK